MTWHRHFHINHAKLNVILIVILVTALVILGICAGLMIVWVMFALVGWIGALLTALIMIVLIILALSVEMDDE